MGGVGGLVLMKTEAVLVALLDFSWCGDVEDAGVNVGCVCEWRCVEREKMLPREKRQNASRS